MSPGPRAVPGPRELSPQAVALAMWNLHYRLNEPGKRNGWHARWINVGVVGVDHPEHRNPAVLATLAERLTATTPWTVEQQPGQLRITEPEPYAGQDEPSMAERYGITEADLLEAGL